MRKIILIVIGFLLIAASIVGANYIIESNNKPKPEVKKIVKTVFVQDVKNTEVPIVLPATGTLVAKNRLELYAEVEGVFRGSAHDFKSGQKYNRGQLLLSLDATEYYSSVQASKSDFKNLVTSLMPDLRLDYPEAFPVWEQYLNSIDVNKALPALPEMSSEKVGYFITGRGVQAAYYTIKNLEQRLGKYRITAPFTGVLTDAPVTKGTLVRSGQKLGEFIDTSVFEVELSVAKSFSDLVKKGKEVALKVPETETSYLGKITRVNPQVDPTTQTITVFAEVKGEGLKEGMYLEAMLEANKQKNAINISRKLLVNEDQVYVVKDSVLALVTIKPVYFAPDNVVVQGVPDGAKLLSKPVPGAFAGMLVKIGENASETSTNVSNQ
ncbi:Secretion protein HlyD [unidentified eubacterium SCB49]|nr:Secretion protein HlyD [unidentified eubacterium SCB49]